MVSKSTRNRKSDAVMLLCLSHGVSVRHKVQQRTVRAEIFAILNSQTFLLCMFCCVCFQGGYAAYRYAQPTAATAAAYSDR